MGRPAIHPIQEFQGVRYYRKPPGYYKADKGDYLHRDVWRAHHGPIPDGWDVHHKDENRANCEIDNLECMSNSEHASLHGRERHHRDPERGRRHMEAIRPLAAAWHGSDEGRAWHQDHARKVAAALPVEHHRCVRCDAEYEVKRGARKRGYCSAACQSAARRASGVDDEQRACAICAEPFTVNRYSGTRTCGRRCAGLLARAADGQGL